MINNHFLNEEEKEELKSYFWKVNRTQSSRLRYIAILRLYLIAGILLMTFGLGSFIYYTFNIKFTYEQEMALAFTASGLLLTVIVWILTKFRKQQEKYKIDQLRQVEINYEFIWKWSEFESLSRKILIKMKKKFNKYSIKEVINSLHSKGIIDESDTYFLERAIQTRNIILHQGKLLPNDVINEYTKRMDNINVKLLQLFPERLK